MLVEEIDAIGPEPPERRVGDLPDALRPAVQAGFRIPILETELGCNHDLVPEGSQRLAHQLLVGEGTVGLGGVEERDAALERLPDERDRLLLLERRAVAGAQAHASQTKGRDLQVATTQLALFHLSSLVDLGPSGLS